MYLLNWVNTNRIKLAIILIIIGLLLFLRSRANQDSYIPYTVESKTLTETLELSGTVEADAIANLHFSTGGLVTYSPFKEGDQVSKYSTIASLDQRQLELSLKKLLNLYAKERHDFDQTQDDNETEIDAGNVEQELVRILESAQYDLDNSVIDVEIQSLAIKLSRLYSPLNGILVHSPITVPNINVGITDVWTIVDPTTLVFTADLDETDLEKVKVGQHVTIVLDAYPDKDFPSTISSISYSPKETTTGTTYEIKIPLPKEAMADLRLGLNGSVVINIGEKADALTLPQSAISIEPEGTIVYVKEGNKYEKKNIVMGISDGDNVEIVNGISKGDVVYVKEEE